MLTILIAIVFFSIMIMVHELGHFLAARLVGIKAEEFSIGMGPKLFTFSGKETRFSVRAFPIGYKALGERTTTIKGFQRAAYGEGWRYRLARL